MKDGILARGEDFQSLAVLCSQFNASKQFCTCRAVSGNSVPESPASSRTGVVPCSKRRQDKFHGKRKRMMGFHWESMLRDFAECAMILYCSISFRVSGNHICVSKSKRCVICQRNAEQEVPSVRITKSWQMRSVVWMTVHPPLAWNLHLNEEMPRLGTIYLQNDAQWIQCRLRQTGTVYGEWRCWDSRRKHGCLKNGHIYNLHRTSNKYNSITQIMFLKTKPTAFGGENKVHSKSIHD